MSRSLLAFDGLACRRGDRLLWRGAVGALHPGDALHATGPNGVGKSSLLRILAGLLPAASGIVVRSTQAALIDEAHALDPERPLADGLRFWAGVDGASRPAIDAALDRLAIAHLAPVPVRILSTGQKKRAALARLLVGDAPLWLLDESANGLDRDGVALLESLIAAHRAAGGAVVLASHQALNVADATILDLASLRP